MGAFEIISFALLLVIIVVSIKLFLTLRALSTLQDENDNYKTISNAFLALTLPAFYKDKHGKFLGANKAFDREFGENKKRAIEELSSLHINTTEKKELLFDNDVEKTVDIYFSNFLDNENNLLGSVGILVNVTQQEEEKKLLLEQKNRLNTALEFSELGYWELNIKEDKAVYSKRWKDIMGYTYEDDEPTTLSSWLNLVDYHDLAKTNEIVRAYLDGKTPMLKLEHRVKNLKEEILWVQACAKATRNSQGTPIKLVGTIKDITDQKTQYQKLNEEKNLFKTFLDNIPIISFIKDKEGRYSYMNNFYQRYFDFVDWKGKNVHDLYSKDIADKMKESDREAFYENISHHNELITTSENDEKLFHTFKFPVEMQKETLLCGIGIDISSEVFYKEQLILSNAILDKINSSIIITNSKRKISKVNKSLQQMTGYLDSEIVGKDIHMLTSQRHSEKFYENLWSELATKGLWSGKIFIKNKDLSETLEIMNAFATTDKKGYIKNYYFISHGLQREKIVAKDTQSMLDSVTALPNKSAFHEMLDIAISKSDRNQERFSVIYINIDDFNVISSSKGKTNAEHALKEVGQKLSTLIRQNDAIAKLDSDEFVILLEDLRTNQDIHIICNRILEEMKKPIKLENIDEILSVSMGASIYPTHSHEAKKLIDFAHTAMYKAKRDGKNTYTIYDS